MTIKIAVNKTIGIIFLIFICKNIVAQDFSYSFTDPFAPSIKFEKEVHNYGNIKKGANGQCEFTFKNAGKDPLIIEKVESECGCVAIKWPKKPIRKGKEGKITVLYYTERLGNIDKRLTVKSNTPGGISTLQLQGTIVAEEEKKTN